MTKDELRKSLDFVNEERERLQYDINNLTYQLAMKKAELDEANDSVTWWHNRFNALQKELERKNNIIKDVLVHIKATTEWKKYKDDYKLVGEDNDKN